MDGWFFLGNMSVVNGTSILYYIISKKCIGICYHAVREAYAVDIWNIGLKGKLQYFQLPN